MSEKLPNVLPLKAFTREASSERSQQLEYTDALREETGKIIVESRLQNQLEMAEQHGDHIEADKRRNQLGRTYLVLMAFQMTESLTAEDKQLWADAFTQKSAELYGVPEKALAQTLVDIQVAQAVHADVDPALTEEYKEAAEAVGLQVEQSADAERLSFEFENAQKHLRQYLSDEYGHVYAEMGIAEHEGVFTPRDIAETFSRGMNVLAASDPAWKKWKVEVRKDKDTLSVEGATKTVVVGAQRADATPQQMEGLFAHEILRHVQTSINGEKIDPRLKGGVSGYLGFEEGMGVFHEYALSGVIKDETVDRYTDIALALGYAGEEVRKPRSQLLQYALSREKVRNAQRNDEAILSDEEMKKKVYTHINRIYRGTPGTDSAVGVFTKDIAYLEGFLKAGRYIESELESGRGIHDIMAYVSQGKFDPTDPDHREYVKNVQKTKPSKELVQMI